MRNDGWTLVYKETNQPVKCGDVVTSFRGDNYTVMPGLGVPPLHNSSTGKIWVRLRDNKYTSEHYPSVFDCKWIVDAHHIPEPTS